MEPASINEDLYIERLNAMSPEARKRLFEGEWPRVPSRTEEIQEIGRRMAADLSAKQEASIIAQFKAFGIEREDIEAVADDFVLEIYPLESGGSIDDRLWFRQRVVMKRKEAKP